MPGSRRKGSGLKPLLMPDRDVGMAAGSAMFGSVLVANRGEAAVRVTRTLRRIGIESIAVFSDADVGGKHVREADRALRIGGSPATESYLNSAAIVAAAVEAGAEAVHPGYGFLSESPDFARAVLEAGLVWVGPSPEVLELSGDKAAAREAFDRSGFPVLPGAGPFRDPEHAMVAAGKIGYPLIVKATMGGGGIGMTVLDREAELRGALDRAANAGARFFGDGSVYLENYVRGSRHIEVQILADGETATHVYERECSVQRRHQKVIEEAPSPAFAGGSALGDDQLRADMTGAAVRSMVAIGYQGAGTVECVLSPDGEYFFLEVNARLQVEHPVTEATTGLDLVEEQLRIARGWGKSFGSPPERRGHAIECRIYAEDPERFLPSPGTIEALELPDGARHDFGYESGDDVPMFYDPLIGKTIAWGDDRDAAISTMRAALEGTRITGIKTNVPTHLRVLDDDRFLSGSYDTGILQT